MSLGVWPQVSLKSAREKKDAALRLLAEGQDPLAEAREEKAQARTFGDVYKEWFYRKSAKWAASYIRTTRLRAARYLAPTLFPRPFKELGTPDFLEILRDIEARGKPETAKRMAQMCGQVCRYAKVIGVIDRDPMENVSEVLDPPRPSHFPAIVDPKQLGVLLRAIYQHPGRASTSFALRVMPYVFVRSGELRGA